ncbi:MAG: uroporphyrinogen-III C-methyltransferase [Gammaproteobacteria bacterium]
MTEQDKQADATEAKPAKPEKQAAKSTPANKPSAARSKKRHTAQYLMLILLLVLAGAGAAGYYGLQFYKKQMARLDKLSDQQAQLQQENDDLKSNLDESLQSLSKQQADLANDIQSLRNKNQFLRKDWLVMEAEYLLQLANYRLLFDRDVNTSIVALQTADDRLHETGDPGLISVRKSIAESVQALKAVPQVDLAGMSLTLSALAKDIKTLPLNTPEPRKRIEQQQKQKAATRQIKSWSQLPAAIWSDLKSLIIIRDHAQPVEPLLPPQQRFFLIENLRLQIEQARLAMLTGHASVFKERLTTAIHWIEKYFDPEAAPTQAAIATLKKLQASDIAPALPDISKPYHLLEEYRQQQKADAESN